MSLPVLKRVADPATAENFRILSQYLVDLPLLKGEFKHFSFTLKNVSYPYTVKIPHGLKFQPQDVILTNVLGATPTFLYSRFTATDIYVTVSAASTFRCFLGSYSEGRTN